MKPIKVFYSELSGKFFASQHYRQDGENTIVITGKKYDVTDDIGEAVLRHGITFKVVK